MRSDKPLIQPESGKSRFLNIDMTKAEKLKESIKIPVMIDEVKDLPDFNMCRCTYFAIASYMPSSEISVTPRAKIPFVMVGYTGVIFRPSNRSKLFDTTKKIDRLLERVESTPGLFVDINDIWLPYFIFKEKEHCQRGGVYRISDQLFKLAFKFQNEMISQEKFVKECEKLQLNADFSEKETKEFSRWGQQQINRAKVYFRANPKKWLKTPQKVKKELS